MEMTLMDFTQRLILISDFSQGKAGKIFNDVYEKKNCTNGKIYGGDGKYPIV